MAGLLAQFYEEHSSLAAVLNAMSALVREVRERGKRIDPKVFRAILYYLDVFPEREHHRKEESVLFPRIRQRTRDADAILDQLAQEHAAGEDAIRDLTKAFVRYEEQGDAEFAPFADAVDRYVKRYFEHMRKEEREVMPIARLVLSPQDWAEMEAEFAAHRDPLAGASTETEHDQLFRRIVTIVPAPFGVGPPLDA
ncbi:MAG: hemerythrin domain-containing protein [Burkholderiaceae bacterium]